MPFIGAELVELEELPFDAVAALGALLTGVEVGELEELPFDTLEPLFEFAWDELAEAPHAVSTNTRIVKIVIAIIFFIRSPFSYEVCSISRAFFWLVKKVC